MGGTFDDLGVGMATFIETCVMNHPVPMPGSEPNPVYEVKPGLKLVLGS